ncbi:MAG: hypothetical protein Q8R48_01070 [Candidatus Omnitrophota bacterium]|nr:hypothetical protein [Candidatus Omnitrophota bacterium]
MAKAIALLSGGLDSILAARLMLEQGIEVEAINFLTVFCTCTTKGKTCLASKSAADTLGIKLKVFEISKEYFEIIKHPKYGYGRNMNPCLDCRIFIFKKAKEYMESTGADFLITGEVLGERPMSQRRDAMMIIERDSGLKGMILRPLSAKLMEPTIPEKNGMVDREKLLAIEGRSRKPQIQLAKDFSINDYPCPAGGCLLTCSGFADKVRDLIEFKPDFTLNDVLLLKQGRHFRLTPETKLIVGKDEEDNAKLKKLTQEQDLYFYPLSIKGPVSAGRGIFDESCLMKAAAIIARYCDRGSDAADVDIAYKALPDGKEKIISTKPMDENILEQFRI